MIREYSVSTILGEENLLGPPPQSIAGQYDAEDTQIFFQASAFVSLEGDAFLQHRLCPCYCSCVVAGDGWAGVGPGESDPKELEALQRITGFWLSRLLGSTACAAPALSAGAPGTRGWGPLWWQLGCLQPPMELDLKFLPKPPCVPEATWRGDA